MVLCLPISYVCAWGHSQPAGSPLSIVWALLPTIHGLGLPAPCRSLTAPEALEAWHLLTSHLCSVFEGRRKKCWFGLFCIWKPCTVPLRPWVRVTAMAWSFSLSSRKAEEQLIWTAAQPVWACTTLGYWRSSWQNKGSDNLSCVSLLLNKRFLACTSSKQNQLSLVMGVSKSKERCSVWVCTLVRLTETVYRMWITSPSLERSALGTRPHSHSAGAADHRHWVPWERAVSKTCLLYFAWGRAASTCSLLTFRFPLHSWKEFFFFF